SKRGDAAAHPRHRWHTVDARDADRRIMSSNDQPSPNDADLALLRGKIDEIDAQLQRLIADRARVAKGIGTLKGLTKTADFYRPEREAQVLRRVVERNEGPLRNE